VYPTQPDCLASIEHSLSSSLCRDQPVE